MNATKIADQRTMTTPPSIADLSSDEKRRLLAKLLRQRAEKERSFPLSLGQSGMWVTAQADRVNPVYNMSFCSRFRTQLDLQAFRNTMQSLVDRHACLRTHFYEENGHLRQRVEPKYAFNVEVIDAAKLSDKELQDRLVEGLSRPFDLEHDCPMRVVLFARSANDHICLLVAHHIVIDFWSTVIMQKELHTLYSLYRDGRRIDLAPVVNTYRDFVHWQSTLLQSERGQELADFWDSQVAGADHVLHLPSDKKRPEIFTYRGNVVACHFNAGLSQRLNDLASQQKATLYSVLLAGFQLLLGRYTNQTQFMIGTPYSGRGKSEFEGIVGCFVNLLPVRADLSGHPTFREVVDRTFQTAMEVLQHQDYPFTKIVERAAIDRDSSRTPLIQASLTLQKSHRRDQAATTSFMMPDVEAEQPFGELDEQAYYVDHPSCQHDLELMLEQSGDTINGLMRYYADAFEPETVERFVCNLEMLLDSATRNPDTPIHQLQWFSNEERQQVVHDWNDTHRDFGPPQTLHSQFSECARLVPNAVAITDGGTRLTYRQLDELSNRQANRLIESGVRPQDLVAVDLDRSAELIIAIVGIWKAGAVYVPLNPASPDERKREIVSRAAATKVLSRNASHFESGVAVEEVAEILATDAIDSTNPPNVDVSPKDAAYVIFTSGSTGKPKGVIVEHRAFGNTIAWRQDTIAVGETDNVLLLVPHFFDASLCITMQALIGGANLVLANNDVVLDTARLSDFIQENKITLLPMPPRLLRVLMEHGDLEKLRSIKRIHTGGETMPPELPGLVAEKLSVPFENLYGPTEAAVEATWKSCSADGADANRIGRPIANVQTYVVDEHLQPVAIGVIGELCIAGSGLARGYLGDEELTSQRFVPNPFVDDTSARMYRTGDQCRWLSNGEIEFVGRVDHQVKVRGYRIELGEIENTLRNHSAIDDVAVVTHKVAGDDDVSLVAYVVVNDTRPNVSELRSYLESRLPSYMVPRFYEFLESLPYTPSGKLDRNALPAPNTDVANRLFVAPRTELESFLAEIWQDLLPGQTVGIHDNFYDLGGSSLKGAMLLSRMQDRMGEQIRLATVFHLPDVASLARYLGETYPETVVREFGAESLPVGYSAEDMEQSAGQSLLISLQPDGDRPPLFLVHPPGGIVVCYQALSRLLPSNQPTYGIRSRGLYGNEDLPESLVEMAAEYIEQIRTVQPKGPYLIGGWSLGGVIAYEIAQQLSAAGETVEQLLMLDTTVPSEEDDDSGKEYGIEMTFGELAELPPDEQLPYLFEHAQKVGVVDTDTPEQLVTQILDDLKRLFHHHVTLANSYEIQPYGGTITMFRPDDAPVDVPISPDRGWKNYADVRVESVTGQHHSMVRPPHVDVLAEKIAAVIDR
ncbi:MAG: amino acid adenylation domain-containing protein [Planctomycetales bacterium]|nr:amino acid adenylation domain-containing protein [Planctomycetales bacterium]